MNGRQFHNALRILRGIDQYEVPWMTGAQWVNFRADPYTFCIVCADEDFDRVWAVVEARQPKSAA